MNPVFPSILSTNFFNLHDKLTAFDTYGIDVIHLDVMDGHFVDNISFGPSASTSIKSAFNFKIDSHLMVSNPGKIIPKFIKAGSDWVSFHVETSEDIAENIKRITGEGRKAGLVVNPDTPADRVFPYLQDIGYVLFMSVYPGYGGQKFIPGTLPKVKQLKQKIKEMGTDCLIQVDGGVNLENIPLIMDAGADLLVIGTFLFNSDDIETTLRHIGNKINGV